MIHVAENGKEWAEVCAERDGYRCASETHDARCNGQRECTHHLVLKQHLPDEARYVLENGLSLSQICHMLAHSTHNASAGLKRANEAVKAVNVLICARGLTKIPPFRKKAA